MSSRKLLFAFGLAAGVLLAQSKPAPAAGGAAQSSLPEPTKLVRLDVLATEDGKPVTDLTVDDFRVTDQGKDQKITSFRARGAQPAPGPNEYSDRAEAAHPVVAVLFDLLNEVMADRMDAWRRIGRSLQQVQNGDSVYFYLLAVDGSLSPIHAIPESGSGATGDGAWLQDLPKLMEKAKHDLNRPIPAGLQDEDRVKKTYVGLEQLSTRLGAFPGRRSIVWVTDAVPYVTNPNVRCPGQWYDCSLYLPHVAITLQANNTAVYPTSYAGGTDPTVGQVMDQFASLTNGQAFFSKEIADVVAVASQAASNSYAIAYDPSAEDWDSKMHHLHVTCSRKGVHVQTKEFYYALPDQRPATARAQAAFVAALRSPSDVSEIGVRATVSPGADASKLHLQVHIDPADLMIQQQVDHFTGQAVIMFANYGADGMMKGEPALQTIDLTLTSDQHQQVMKEGVPFAWDQSVDPAVKKVRVIVLDSYTDAIGSVTVPAGAH